MKISQESIERKPALLIILIILVVAVGGLVEIVPLAFQKSVTEPVSGLKPYGALELTGRDIYIREGCNNCHSQMIRPFRAEVERYGAYSVAGEFVYDHPFQWGSKRTGPDLARVGGRYSDEWHAAHLRDPRSVVEGSVMPGYPFLARTPLRTDDVAARLKANRGVGVPYSDDMVSHAAADLQVQANPDAGDAADFLKRYPKAQTRDFDGNPAFLSEADALIAYLQMLGTLVDFDAYDPQAPGNSR
jgi:cytochrome c oxidase cbb3-type subunit 2